MPESTPAWEHDCEYCVYLGTTDYDGSPVDLYYYDHTQFEPHGLIARGGNQPWNNSVWNLGWQGDPSLKGAPYFAEAFRLWRERYPDRDVENPSKSV